MSEQGDNHVASGQLRTFIERIERLEEEKATIAEDIKEVFAEAKGYGYDIKVMRMALKIRKANPDTLADQQALLDTYLDAMGMEGTPLGHWLARQKEGASHASAKLH